MTKPTTSQALAKKRVYSSYMVASLLDVSPRTASKMIDSGAIKGHRLPTSKGERRVDEEDLIAFLKEHRFYRALSKIMVKGGSLLLVGCSEGMANALRLESACPPVLTASSFYEAGALCHDGRPKWVVFDFALGRSECFGAARYMLSHPPRPGLFGLAYDDDSGQGKELVFDKILPISIPAKEMLTIISEVVVS